MRQRMGAVAQDEWRRLRPLLAVVPDVLTLDRGDFRNVMATGFYGLPVMTPGGFLRRERDAGRLLG